MGPRKCIYTNKEATASDRLIPKNRGDALHNWANRAPASAEYLKGKAGRLPTDLEMEAHRIFHLLELARLEVTYLEERLKDVQEQITGVKQDQIEKAHHIKDLTEDFQNNVEEILEKKSKDKIWE